MPEEKSQARILLELIPKIVPYWKVILIVSLILGGAAGFFIHQRFEMSYTSEVVMLVRAQPTLEEAAGQVQLKDKVVLPLASIVPGRLTVEDYVMIWESDAVMGIVLQEFRSRYAAQYPGDELPNRRALKKMLRATSHVMLKTPYDVKYFPTIMLTAEAYSPEMARDLLALWVEIGKQQTADLTYSAQIRKSYEAVETQYQEGLEKLRAKNLERQQLRQENSRALAALGPEQTPRRELLEYQCQRAEELLDMDYECQVTTLQDIATSRHQANLAVAQAVEELEVLSEPPLPEPREKPPLVVFLLGGFLVILVCMVVLCTIHAIVREVSAASART